jgi:hypothetical protein
MKLAAHSTKPPPPTTMVRKTTSDPVLLLLDTIISATLICRYRTPSNIQNGKKTDTLVRAGDRQQNREQVAEVEYLGIKISTNGKVEEEENIK